MSALLDQAVLGHLIDGEIVPSLDEQTFASVNPATAEPLATVAYGGPHDVHRAVRSAARAFEDRAWRDMPAARRASLLRRLATLVRERADEIARLDALDAGMPISNGLEDVEAAAEMLDYYATLPENIRGTVYPREAGVLTLGQRTPYGVVGAIAPWNFPFIFAVSKTAPALATGNTVVLKMAEQTPLSALLYGQLALEAGFPPGALNVVHGDGRTGAALASHPDVPKVTFTGSTDVGRAILHAGADTIKSVHLELGGKSANIVFADADLDQVVDGTLFTGYFNSGQVCTAGSRLLVERSILDEVAERLVAAVERLRVGDPLDEQTHLGPLVSAEQRDRVLSYVRGGLEEGGSLLTGSADGHPDGFYVSPVVLGDVEPAMRVAQEEIFGPVVTVTPFDDVDEAVRIANDVPYALAATVWTSRLDTALDMGDRLDAGTVWTNAPHHLPAHVPYEGHGASGLGEDQGMEAIATFTQLKVQHVGFAGRRLGWGV